MANKEVDGIPLTVFDSLVQQWLQRSDLGETTRETYQQGIYQFTDWLTNNRQPITAKTVRQWRDWLIEGYSAGSVNVWLSALRSFFAWLYEQGHISSNPAEGIRGARRRGTAKKHKRDELTAAEVRRVLEAVSGDSEEARRNCAIITLMAFCGLRQIEVQRADVADLQTRGGRLILWVQGKGSASKDDYVVLPPPAEQAIRDWLVVRRQIRAGKPKSEELSPLFCSVGHRNYGGRLTTRSIRKIVKDAFVLAGVVGDNKTTHSLRHSAITSAIRNGASITQVQAMARHSNVNTTMIYFHETGRIENPAEDFINYGES